MKKKTNSKTLSVNPMVALAAALGIVSILCMSFPASAAQKYVEKTTSRGIKGVVPINNLGIVEVPVSNTEINRIVSDQEIHNIKLPESAKLTVDGGGYNAFLEAKGTKSEVIYITTETTVYSIKIKPTRIGAQKLHLVFDKKQKVVVPLIGNEREKVAVKLIKAAYKEGEILEKARTTRLYEKKKLIKDIEIRAYRRYDFDEDNLNVTLYVLRLGKGFNLEKLDISEKMFLIPELCPQPLGLSLSRDYLTKKDYTRLFIVGRN
jgi:hypothetical protein